MVSGEDRPRVAPSSHEPLDVAAAESTLHALASALFPAGTPDLTQLTWDGSGNGEPRHTTRSVGDARVSTEAKLQAAELRYRTLVEQIPAVTFMAVLGEGENEVYVSPHIESLLGFTQKEWLENPFLWYSQLHPDDRTLWNDEFARGCSTGGPFRAECRFIARDGGVVWVRGEARLVKDELGRPLFLQGVAFDITESKRAQARQLREAIGSTEERYRSLVEQIGAIFFEVEVKTASFTFVSRGAERILGFSRERWLADPRFWISCVHPEDRTMASDLWEHALANGGDHEFEFRAFTADQREVWLHARVRDAQSLGQRSLLGVVLDVTDRKRIEEERARLYAAAEDARHAAETANRTKDEFLATMSHELKTPLNALLGYAHLLRNKQMPAAMVETALEKIERSALVQAKLVDDLLDVSRIITGKLHLEMADVDLLTVVDAALDPVRLAAEAKSITLKRVMNAPRLIVRGDAVRLQQVAWNLVSNAIKFTPENGQVEIRLDRVGTQARIRVTDSGQGIDPDFLPHVFDRFRQADSSLTRRFGGLGLGLAIVRHLTEMHGGTVAAESRGLGHGASFTVSFPLRQSPPNPSVEPAPAQTVDTPSLHGIRILVVDDDADARDLLRTVLTNAGAEVTTANSAARALREVQRVRPDLLISDIGMPGQDGYQLLRHIREAGMTESELPAIAVTAYSSDAHRDRAFEAGFQEHVPKPINVATIVQVIARLLEQSSV
jgi:PAS domain S-box-containing protein